MSVADVLFRSRVILGSSPERLGGERKLCASDSGEKQAELKQLEAGIDRGRSSRKPSRPVARWKQGFQHSTLPFRVPHCRKGFSVPTGKTSDRLKTQHGVVGR
jgi:hypothetical protein